MRFRTSLCLATLFLVCFTIAAWSTPLPAETAADSLQPAPDNQSLSGPIASVGDAEFSVQVTKDKDKLPGGAKPTVEYRSDAGKTTAFRVILTPASGMGLY